MIRILKTIFAASAFFLLSATAFGQHYNQTNLVSDIPGLAMTTDSNLKNPWGLTRSATSPWWIANNGTGTTVLYDGKGNLISIGGQPFVTIPPPASGSGPSTPTGAVFNGTTDFNVAAGKPAIFIFVTEDGTISGWNPGVDLHNAVLKVDNSASGAVYKGVTLSEIDGKHFLYVTNFHSGRIEVYDTNFHQVHMSGEFFDDNDDNDDEMAGGLKSVSFLGRRVHSPEKGFEGNGIPHGFAPFNVQAIGGNIFVTFAKQDQKKAGEIDGPGLGFVEVFTPRGEHLARLERGLWFNAPWGVTMAPGDFGEFSHTILVGNFGSGQIAAFNPVTGGFLGLMRNPDDSVLTIDRLWALAFGGAGTTAPFNALFFTAGIQNEQHGLFGTLTAIPAEQNGDEP